MSQQIKKLYFDKKMSISEILNKYLEQGVEITRRQILKVVNGL